MFAIVMSKILITGASGFIGSFLVERFLEDPSMEVFAGIRATSSKVYLQDKRIQFFDFDLKNVDRSRDQAVKEQFDYVIHAAGITQTGKAADYDRLNGDVTLAFYQQFADLSQPPKKFIYLSSLGAYGPADFQSDGMVRDTSVPHPVTAYGRSKLRAENLIKEDGRLPYVMIRPTAVYGPREKNMLTVFDLINKGVEAHIGLSKQKLTFIYVKDLVELIYRATTSGHENKSYFAASKTVYSSEELATFAKLYLGKKTIKINLPIPLVKASAWVTEKISNLTGKYSVFNIDKVNELKSQSWVCDVDTVERDLGFTNQYSLQQGLAETLQWYKDQKWL